MDSKDLKALFNLVLIILFVAATVLGPLIDRWRKKREAERRRLQGQPEEEPAPPPGPAYDTEDRPKLPYENVLEEVFGPYIERRRRAAQEAAEAPPEPAAPEVDPDDEIRRMREARRPAEKVVVAPPVPEEAPRSIVSMERIRTGRVEAAETVRRVRSLDDILFRNPRLAPGAKLLLASEILGKPRGRR
jgi:hypothetical protein